MKLHEIKKIPQQGSSNPFDLSVIKDLRPYKNANVEGHELLFMQHGDEQFKMQILNALVYRNLQGEQHEVISASRLL